MRAPGAVEFGDDLDSGDGISTGFFPCLFREAASKKLQEIIDLDGEEAPPRGLLRRGQLMRESLE